MKLNHSYSAFKLFDNCPLRYYRQRVLKDVKDEMGVAGLEGDRQHKALENRVAFGTPLPADMSGLEELVDAVVSTTRGAHIFAEKELVINRDLKPTGWWDADVFFRSKADLFAINDGDTRAVIIDWKTGKRRPDFLQMQLMSMAGFMHYPTLERIDTMFVWLKEKEQDSETYRRSELPSLTTTLLTYVARIERALENEKWPAKPGWLCPYCPARTTCKWA